ncbi:hypothetical protein ACRAWF_27450 [Streptomyces sp. L7]
MISDARLDAVVQLLRPAPKSSTTKPGPRSTALAAPGTPTSRAYTKPGQDQAEAIHIAGLLFVLGCAVRTR